MDQPSRERVAARLARLREEYEGFDVQQTTVTVRPEEYERAAATPGAADVRVRVRNADGEVLTVDGDPPETTVENGCDLAVAAREAVAETTGVEPVVEGLDHVAIVCVRDEERDDSVYRLSAEFTANAPEVDPPGEAAWREASGLDVSF